MISSQAGLIAEGLFWLFVLGTLLLPWKWALFTWVLAAQLDLSAGIGWQSSSMIGMGNIVRVMIIPSILLLRLRAWRVIGLSLRLYTFRLWLAFFMYVLVASFWSPFPLSAGKLVGYFYAYTVSFLVFFSACRKGYIDYRLLLAYLWGVLFLAILQTWWLGNQFGGVDKRFTSFLSPQYFSQSLNYLMIIFLFMPGIKWRKRLIYVAILITAIFLSGSRTGFLTGIIVLAFAFWVYARSVISAQRILNSYALLLVFAGLMAMFYFSPLSSGSNANRTLEIFTWLSKDSSVSDIGTLGFRVGMWEATIFQITRSHWWQLLFGHGTASGANVALMAFSRYNEASIDANRVIHNEFLRVLYEWGFLGLTLFTLFLTTLLAGAKRRIHQNKSAIMLIPTMTTIFLFLFVENVFAGGGNAAGIALTLNLALVVSALFTDATTSRTIEYSEKPIRPRRNVSLGVG